MKIGLPHVVVLGAGASRAAFPQGDRNGLKLPLMNDLVETVGLGDLLDSSGIDYEGKNFEDVYDDLSRNPATILIVRDINDRIYDYFCQISLPTSLTIYDRLVLSLRKKDLIATFNWDPLLALACRRNSHLAESPRIVSLHGNVAIGICEKDKTKGINGDPCAVCRERLQPSQLLYPIKQKNYTDDPFLKNEWDELEWYLERAYFLTIFGYSAPSADVEAVRLMKKVWHKNKYRDLAEIELIDIKPSDELVKSWRGFIVRQHYGTMREYGHSHLSRYPRRSCEGLFMATMQNMPWPNNFPPEEMPLEEYQGWIRLLILEEKNKENDDHGFSGLPCDKLREIYQG